MKALWPALQQRLSRLLGLRTRIVGGVVLAVLAATLLVTLASLSVGRQEMTTAIAADQGVLLQRTADEIDQKFQRRRISLRLLAEKIPLQERLNESALQRYLEQQSEMLVWFDNLLVIRADGEIVANVNDAASRGQFNVATREYFKRTMATRAGVISQPLRSVISQRPVVLITAPVFNTAGEIVLILVGTVDLGQENFLSNLGHAHIGKTGYFYIVTSDGMFVSHPLTELVLQPAQPLLASSPALARALAGFEGTLESSDSLGVKGLFSSRRLQSINWIIGSVLPEQEAYAAIDRVEHRSLFILLLLLLVAGPMAWWIIDRQLRPLDQLAARIDAVRRQPSLVALPTNYARTEFGRLAHSFDELMRERLFAETRYQSSAEELRAATDSTLDAFFVLQAERDAAGELIDFRFRYLNENGARMLGLPREQVLDQRLCELVPINRTGGFFDRYAEVLRSGVALQEEFAIDTPGIHASWLAHQVTPLADGVAITSRDISQRKRDDIEMHANRAFLQSLVEHLPVIVYSKSLQPATYGRYVLWNKAAERITGFSAAHVIGKTSREIFPPGVARAYEQHDLGILDTRQPIEIPVFPVRRPDGAVRVLRTQSLPLLDEAGQVEFVLGIAEDITERRAEHAALEFSEQRLRLITDHLPALVAYLDRHERYQFCNAFYLQNQHIEPASMLGQTIRQTFSADDYAQMAPHVAAALRGEHQSFERFSLTPEGERHYQCEYIPDVGADGTVQGFYAMTTEITGRKAMEQQMTHLAAHDALTGLLNRREFEYRLEQAVASAGNHGKEHTLLYLDLDQFKIVNDTCGHVAGDELLRQLAALLLAQLRQSDTLARLGGDEFGVLLEGCGTEPALRVADQLRQTVCDFHFAWLDKSFPIGVSIGLVTFSTGVTLPDILRMADSACYVAKDKGRNRVHVYTEENAELMHRQGQMSWIARLRDALDADRFVLYRQTILGLIDAGQGEHYELLLRLRGDDGQLIPPMAFIPAAERYGLMPLLDRWVIRHALAGHAARHPSGTPPGMAAINLSGTSICDETFLPFVLAQFAASGVPPSEICFEITETAAIANLNQAAVLIRELKAIGCKFSLDDFGSGMSSFTYLKHLPVDFLKIDGSFVKDMIDDPIDRAMVESIHHIGHVMGLRTIAEFVESDAILAALREIGVDHAQGYAIGKPVAC